MPDFTTHILFGEKLLSLMPPDAREAAEGALPAYYWGTQGPDPLFYAVGSKGNRLLPQLGGLMHRQRIGLLFEEMALAAGEESGPEGTFLRAYLLGFLAHYALDRRVHPYVYCLSQRRRKALPENTWDSIHIRVECHIDDLLYPRMKKGQPVQNFRPGAFCPLDDQSLQWLAKLYQRVLENVYGQSVSREDLTAAFRSCLRYTKAFYGPFRGITAWLARFADRKARCPGLYSGHVKGLLGGDDNDVLNLHNRPWRNLAQDGPLCTDSVPQLMDQAAGEWLDLLPGLMAPAPGAIASLEGFALSFDNGNPEPPDDSSWMEQTEETGGKEPAPSLP